MPSLDSLCTECIYSTQQRIPYTPCRMEGSPKLVGNVSPADMSSPDCAYYTCSEGIASAIAEFFNYQDDLIRELSNIIVFTYEGNELELIPFGTEHKPFNFVKRYISNETTPLIFIFYPNFGICLGPERLQNRLKNELKKYY